MEQSQHLQESPLSDSNRRPVPYHGSAPPAELRGGGPRDADLHFVASGFREGEVAVTERTDARDALDQLVTESAQQITRLAPADAAAACEAGGLIIDIRSQEARKAHGVVPGSLHIPRTVLEWRVALDSQWRSPHVGGLDQQLILICDHGYSSVLAAANLAQLGHPAGDGATGLERHGTGLRRCHIGDNRV